MSSSKRKTRKNSPAKIVADPYGVLLRIAGSPPPVESAASDRVYARLRLCVAELTQLLQVEPTTDNARLLYNAESKLIRSGYVSFANELRGILRSFEEGPFPELRLPKYRVELLEVSPLLLTILKEKPSELYRLRPEQFEALVQERFQAMGYGTHRVGHSNARDGGIDLVLWPEAGSGACIPFLGAVQIKHHRTESRLVGPGAVRDFRGALQGQPFSFGLLVTNTTFTPDARWAASQLAGLIKLRDLEDLARWLQGNFLHDCEWRDLPKELQLAPGVIVTLPHRLITA